MNTQTPPPPNLPRSLLDPWASLRGRVLAGVALWAATVLLWMAIAGFELSRLVRTGPWELLGLAFSAAVVQLGLYGMHLRGRADPRALHLAGLMLPLGLAMMLLGGLVQRLTPLWVYAYAERSIHGSNGLMVGATLAIPIMAVFFMVNDMRLSALDPEREARMRTAAMAKRERREAKSRWRRWLAVVVDHASWQVPLTAQSKALDAYTLPRVLLVTLIDYIALTIFFGILIEVVAALGVFGTVQAGKALATRFEAAFDRWSVTLAFIAVISSGSWLLALARRFAPWLNHTAPACVLGVLLAHFLSAVVAAKVVGAEVDARLLAIAAFVLAALCGARMCQVLLTRAQAIDAEHAKKLAQDRAVADAQREHQRSLAIADLKALQAQIEPHFLYNTLANLQLLIRQDSAKADAMAGHLIDYLRARLPAMRASATTLAQEFEMVSNYLALLQIRMGKRLASSIDLPPNCAQAMVAPLMVITLVENAIQHGLEPKRGGGSVHVSARVELGWLVVQVIDTGVGLGAASATRAGSGIGLANLRERLRLQHPNATDWRGLPARAELRDNLPGGTVAELRMPLQLQS